MLRLKLERVTRGWSQQHVGRLLGVGQPMVSALEIGRLLPYPGWRERLARVFEMPCDALFETVPETEEEDQREKAV